MLVSLYIRVWDEGVQLPPVDGSVMKVYNFPRLMVMKVYNFPWLMGLYNFLRLMGLIAKLAFILFRSRTCNGLMKKQAQTVIGYDSKGLMRLHKPTVNSTQLPPVGGSGIKLYNFSSG
jgi:hypothetical protein